MPTINNRFENLTLERLQEIYDIVSIPVSTGLTVGVTTITGGTVGRVLFQGTGNVLQESVNFSWNNATQSLIVVGKIGINNTSPLQTLDMIGGFRTSLSAGNAGAVVMDQLGTSSAGRIYAYNGTGASLNILLTANGFSWLNGGNFAIGTTTDAGFKLDVNGTTRLAGNTLIASAAVQLGSENAKLKVLSGYEGGTMNGVLVEANGATYTTILRHTGSASGSLYIDATNAGLAAMTRAIYINGSSALANYVTFAESGNQRFNISRAGDTTISGNLYKTVNNIFLGLYGGPSGGTVDGFIKIHGGSNFWGMIQFNMGYDATNSKMTWTLSDTTELMRLTGGGNLLLGTTTNAGYKLDVNGTGRISGALSAAGGNATGTGSVSIGTLSSAGGNFYAAAIGYQSTASNSHAIAIGYQATASANSSYAFGKAANASASNSTAFSNAFARADNSFAWGNNSRANGISSMAGGAGAYSYLTGQLAISGGAITYYGDSQYSILTSKLSTNAVNSGGTYSFTGVRPSNETFASGVSQMWYLDCTVMISIKGKNSTVTEFALDDIYTIKYKLAIKSNSNTGTQILGTPVADSSFSNTSMSSTIVSFAIVSNNLVVSVTPPTWSSAGQVIFRGTASFCVTELGTYPQTF